MVVREGYLSLARAGQDMSFQDELQTAMEAALEAGDLMLEYQREGYDVDRKSSYTDMVTDADRACQESIVETIRSSFPDDGFIAEEEHLRETDDERNWIIDPIDGTSNFVHGFPYYCTSIALAVDGRPELGVVYAPEIDAMFHAVRGDGAYRDGERIRVAGEDRLKDALVISRISPQDERLREAESGVVQSLLDVPVLFRRVGSAALNLCQVACGEASGMALLAVHRWDIAAGQVILEEAGGDVRVSESVLDGKLAVIGSNGHIQDRLERLVDES